MRGEQKTRREMSEGVEEYESQKIAESYENLAASIPEEIIKAAGQDVANINAMIEAQRGGVWETFERVSAEEGAEELSFPERMTRANKEATKSQEKIDAELKKIGPTDSADTFIINWLKSFSPEKIRQIASLAQPDMPYYDSGDQSSEEKRNKQLAWVAIRAVARDIGSRS